MGTAEITIFCSLICLHAATATLSTTISPCSSTIWLRSRLQSSMLESRGLFRLVFIACNAVKSSTLPLSLRCCREQANNLYLHPFLPISHVHHSSMSCIFRRFCRTAVSLGSMEMYFLLMYPRSSHRPLPASSRPLFERSMCIYVLLLNR